MFDFLNKLTRGVQDLEVAEEVTEVLPVKQKTQKLNTLTLKELFIKSGHPLSTVSDMTGYKQGYILWCINNENRASLKAINSIKGVFEKMIKGEVEIPPKLDLDEVIARLELKSTIESKKIPVSWIGKESGYTPQYVYSIIKGNIYSHKAFRKIKEAVGRYTKKDKEIPLKKQEVKLEKEKPIKQESFSEISLEDARVLYKVLPHLRPTLLIGFTDDELGIEPIYYRSFEEYVKKVTFTYKEQEIIYCKLSRVYSQYPKGKPSGEVIYIPVKKANSEPEIISVVRAGFTRGEISNYSFPFYEAKYAKEFLEHNKVLLREWLSINKL